MHHEEAFRTRVSIGPDVALLSLGIMPMHQCVPLASPIFRLFERPHVNVVEWLITREAKKRKRK
jgi:hypothetical protein